MKNYVTDTYKTSFLNHKRKSPSFDESETSSSPNRYSSSFQESASNTYSNDSGEEKKESESTIIKNNKIVYIYEPKENLYNQAKKKLLLANKRGKRGSKYRGVSRNGNQWQVLSMLNKNKSYVGSYSSEEVAARIYDAISLKNHGNKAKTNFKYNEEQIKKMICLDFKDRNVQEKIASIFN